MIISCIKCNKKFSVDDNLIPELGRILECGSCSHQWHYIPILLINKNIETKKNENTIKIDEPIIFDKNTDEKEIGVNETIIDNNSNKISIPIVENNNDQVKPISKSKKKKSNLLSNLFVIIITFVALIIILDTFSDKLSSIFPTLDSYLYSLYNVLTDIFLFITNLIK